MKKITFLGIGFATFLGVLTFNAKQKVIALEEQLMQINQKILALQESKHILQAEWSYLMEPSRLQKLAERHAKVMPGRGSAQLVSLEDVVDIKHIPYDENAMVRLASVVEKLIDEKTLR